MSMRLSDADIRSLLPQFMRGDEANAALSRAVNGLIREPGSRIQQLRVWDKIGELGHADLDELAWELNVDWYSTDMSLEAKRETIKYAQQIQAKRGTKWAVECLITAYFGRGYVVEWFETGGKPYTFSVMTTNAEINDTNFSGFIKAVNAAKSARSHLDGVFYYKEQDTLVECLRITDTHLFLYPKCGTKPRPATVGALSERNRIHADAKTSLHLFRYPKPGIKAGTYPRPAVLGTSSERSTEAQGSADIYTFLYPVCGRNPKPGTLGALSQPAALNADARASPYLFRYPKAGTSKAGTTPRLCTTGSTRDIGAGAAASSTLSCFGYIKCGTRRTGQI